MKLKKFLRPAVSLLFCAAALPSPACGPFAPVIPTPDFFVRSGSGMTMADFDREENLLLWQSATSPLIPLSDIEEAVYTDSYDTFIENTSYRPAITANRFYAFLINSGDMESISYLADAKRVEECREEMQSPWYYPSERSGGVEPETFGNILGERRSYKGKRLKERNALLVTRMLFASRDYGACIEYADSAFAGVPDSHLMRRMAMRYAAGCRRRLGDSGRADSIFAATGDIWSLSAPDPVGYMARHNPAAPQLIEYVRRNAADTAFMLRMEPVARRLLDDPRVRNKGDWHFMLAYVSHTFRGDRAAAARHIRSAMAGRFSSDELRDLAHAFKMKVEAPNCDRRALLADLKWIEGRCGLTEPDAWEWIRRCRNVIYIDWIPALWKRGDQATALLLCAYADNLDSDRRLRALTSRGDLRSFPESSGGYYYPFLYYDEGSDSDYGCLSFQMMGSLTSSRLASVHAAMMKSDPLYDFLRRFVRTDADYYNELIGTLALREEDYGRAEKYFSRVSKEYWKSMNIYPYLSRDPFGTYRARRELAGDTSDPPVDAAGAKLDFARRMHRYQQLSRNGRTADERGLARLMYAIGRRNSMGHCWALTQYWDGYVGVFEPVLYWWDEEKVSDVYDFQDRYYEKFDSDAADDLYDKEVRSSLAMLATDEGRARALYILGRLPEVVKSYSGTVTARHIKTSCDNWRHWLRPSS